MAEISAVDIRRAAMDLLARREHGRRELRDKLLRRFPERDSVDQEISRLEQEGLQSDERFAESFVRARLQRRQGPLRIRQELRLRGVDDSLIDRFLAEVVDEVWIETAGEALQNRFGDEVPADRKEWARRARFLQGRGFSHSQIQATMATRN